jgi:hypothetical protein
MRSFIITIISNTMKLIKDANKTEGELYYCHSRTLRIVSNDEKECA